jgi:site-specific recombinase XerD
MVRRISDSRRRTNRSSKRERLPSRETLAALLKRCSSKTRAAVLLLASSGMRVGELVRLRVADLDLTKQPPTIVIRDVIQPRKWRVSYITGEAKHAVESYLFEREDRGEALESDSPLFVYESGSSMTPQAMVSLIRRGFKAAGVSGSSMRLESQVLRRWFKKQLIGTGAPRRVVDFLCGHVRGGHPAEEEVRRWYSLAIPSLTILQATSS